MLAIGRAVCRLCAGRKALLKRAVAIDFVAELEEVVLS